MSAAPSVYRFVIASNEDDDVSAKWPATVTSPLKESPQDQTDFAFMCEMLNECSNELKGASAEEILAWMMEHCPSAVYVQRNAPNDEDGFTTEFLISDPDQAFHFRTRWT